MVMGGIIGVGIFYNPSKVAALSDSSAHALWLWALGGVAALCGAATFAELGARLPQAGGWYVYLREAVHPFVAWLFAWVVVGVISTGAIAVVLAIALQNFSALWPALGAPDTTAGRLTGSVLIVLITAVVAAGVQTGARLQSALMLLKIAAILALVGGAIWLSSTLDSAGSATPAADTVVREGS
jgi:APA family basic amino acid/polyamine antiporter